MTKKPRGTRREGRPEDSGGQWLTAMCELLKGGLAAALAALVALAACALLVSWGVTPERTMDRAALAAGVLGGLTGGLLAVRRIGRSTLLVGAGVGAILFLVLLSAGLLLFADGLGKIPQGMLPQSILYTAAASFAGGCAVELTAWRQRKKMALPAGKTQEKEKLSPPSPPQQDSSFSRQKAAAQRPQPQSASASTQQKGWTPPTSAGNSRPQKGWDPQKHYTRPGENTYRGAVKNRPAPRPSTSPRAVPPSGPLAQAGSDSFPRSIAFFGSSKTTSSCQALSGGIALAIFGDAKLLLRDADYRDTISVTLFSVFGSAKLEVPYVSNLSVTSIPLFGSCKDKRKLVNSRAMPVMYVRCFSLFGDCTIR